MNFSTQKWNLGSLCVIRKILSFFTDSVIRLWRKVKNSRNFQLVLTSKMIFVHKPPFKNGFEPRIKYEINNCTTEDEECLAKKKCKMLSVRILPLLPPSCWFYDLEEHKMRARVNHHKTDKTWGLNWISKLIRATLQRKILPNVKFYLFMTFWATFAREKYESKSI